MHLPPALPMLARGLYNTVDAFRSGDEDDRVLAKNSPPLLRDFVLRAGIVDIGRVLDYALAPGFRRVEVRAPVFVVAPPRSGTTLLYSLLAADPRFLGPRLYESLLPSVSLLALVEGISGLLSRAKTRSAIAGFDRWEERTFAGSDPIHRIRMRELEEDMPLFDRHLTCPSSLRLFARSAKLLPLALLDDRSASTREAVMEAYYRAIQRLLYRAGAPTRTYLAKNVHSASRIGCLRARFPDARFVHIIRHPYDVLPSAVEMFVVSAYVGVPPHARPQMPLDNPQWRVYSDLVIDHYQRLLRWERQLPASQWITVRFHDLIADPQGTVRQIYRRFGIDMSDAAEHAIATAAARASSYRSTKAKRPTLSDVGLSREHVHERLVEVFEAYGLEA